MAKQLDDKFWESRWDDNSIGFHMSTVNSLIKYVSDMTAGQEQCRIFVPLCGKSIDMKWLADRGHTVVGVELASLAVQDFFKENNMEYTKSTVKALNDKEVGVYTSKDGRVVLYEANVFDLNRDILGEFDCIWDRASLVALMREDLQRYVDLMTALVKPNGRCLLQTLIYDQSEMNPPPHSTPPDVVQKLYAGNWDTKYLEERDALSERFKKRGVTAFTARDDLLTKK